MVDEYSRFSLQIAEIRTVSGQYHVSVCLRVGGHRFVGRGPPEFVHRVTPDDLVSISLERGDVLHGDVFIGDQVHVSVRSFPADLGLRGEQLAGSLLPLPAGLGNRTLTSTEFLAMFVVVR